MGRVPDHRLAPVITWRSSLVQGSDCPTCILVGLVLSLYMNERGGSAFPSAPQLAADCCLTDRAVRKHLNEHLHKQGWLTLIERGGQKGDRRRANEWQASTPEHGAGVPLNVVPRPLNENALTPEPGSPQVVHGSSPRSRGRSAFNDTATQRVPGAYDEFVPDDPPDAVDRGESATRARDLRRQLRGG